MSSTHQLYGPARVGGDTLAWCTKCKMDLAHVIVSMIDGRPAKVICKTCRSQHNFKRGAAVSSLPSRRAAAKPAARHVVKVSELWEKKMAEKKTAPLRPYTIQTSFEVGDVIQHPNFGIGLVEEVRRNGKITVLFRDDQRVLVHAYPTP